MDRALLKPYMRAVDNLAQEKKLSRREKELIKQLANGRTTSQALSKKLGISVHTINNHLKSIFTKTEVRSKTDLLVAVMQRFGSIYKDEVEEKKTT